MEINEGVQQLPTEDHQTENNLDMSLDNVDQKKKMDMISKNLQYLGFTLNDSRIYVCLLQIGLSSPAKIAEKSHVDRARVYDSLKRLVKRGIVEEEPVPRAPRYRAIDPEKVFGKIRSGLHNKIELATELQNELVNLKPDNLTENNSVWSIQGESRIKKQFYKIIGEAKEFCYIIFPGDKSTKSIKDLENLTRKILEKKDEFPQMQFQIAMRIFPEIKDQKNYLNQLFHSDIEVYKWNAGNILPFGLYLTENSYIQTYLSSLAPKPQYNGGIFMENVDHGQIAGFQHLCIWTYTYLCQKVVFKKKSKD